MTKSSIINAVSLILIIIFVSLLIKLQIKPKQLTIYNNNQIFEYMSKFKMLVFNEQGILSNEITANYWKFSPNQQYSIIKQPNMTIYKNNKNNEYYYNITANLANIVHESSTNKINFIKLFDNVAVTKKNIHKTNSWINLKTSYLEFNPNTDLANTNKDVIITKPGLLMTGTGMKADLKNNNLELNNNVSTQYISQNK
jgi:LPS export ABC transporter protein LptC